MKNAEAAHLEQLLGGGYQAISFIEAAAPLVVSNSILVTTLAPLVDYLPACI